jgi:predicted O-methyltransferase YrrM
MTFEESIQKSEEQIRNLVWWSPDQIARGEDVLNDPKKGERAWSVPRKTAEFLHNFITINHPKIILELGTSIGYSTLWMAHAASKIGSHIHTIEIRDYKCDIAKETISKAGFSDFVTFHNASILEILADLEKILAGQKIDLVFMDADRGHYHEYFKILEPYLAPGSTIIADNAVNMQARMTPFLSLLKENNWSYEILNFDNGVLIARKHDPNN